LVDSSKVVAVVPSTLPATHFAQPPVVHGHLLGGPQASSNILCDFKEKYGKSIMFEIFGICLM